jgi:hypothetical protein
MMTESVNTPSSRKRANAPAVGSHFPTLKDRMAATIDSQTNSSATMNHATAGSVFPWSKKTWTAPMQEMVSDPPIHTGLVIQYR